MIDTQNWPPNPFGDIGLVNNSTRFVGREATLNRIRPILETDSLHLQGEAKIGKSSLLWLLYQEQLEKGRRAVFGNFKRHDMENIMTKMATSLNVASDLPWPRFCEYLTEQPFYLFLDEFDQAVDKGFNLEWGSRFRGLESENFYNFHLVLATRQDLHEILPDTSKGSEWYSLLAPEQLGPFTEEEALILITSRLPNQVVEEIFIEVTKQHLLKISKCHPFKLMRAAYRYYDQQTNEKTSDWLSKYRADLKHYFGVGVEE
jgi:hypothetical protein